MQISLTDAMDRLHAIEAMTFWDSRSSKTVEAMGIERLFNANTAVGICHHEDDELG